MRREPFMSPRARLTLGYVLVFSTSIAFLGATTWLFLRAALEEQLRQQIDAEVAQLLGDYEQDGLDELTHDIAERIEALPPHRLRYHLQNDAGRVIFDPSGPLPTPGWHRVATDDSTPMLQRTVDLADGYRLGVSADLAGIGALGRALRQSASGVLALTLLLGVAGAWWFQRAFERRLQAFRDAAERVGSGSLAERMPVGQGDAELDNIAVLINGMLDRIEQLVEEVRRVGTSIAHDMRTPLSHLRQGLEEAADAHPELREECEVLMARLDDALAVFAALLRIAEIESGARRSGFERFDLSAVTQRVCGALGLSLDEAGIALDIEVTPGVEVRGDPTMMSQLVVNLLENVLRHAQAHRCRVVLRRDADRVVLSVSDDGVGVPATLLTRLTEPFFRADRSRSTAGTGLGLSMVAAIVREHDGELRIEPSELGGMAVTVLLPGGTRP